MAIRVVEEETPGIKGHPMDHFLADFAVLSLTDHDRIALPSDPDDVVGQFESPHGGVSYGWRSGVELVCLALWGDASSGSGVTVDNLSGRINVASTRTLVWSGLALLIAAVIGYFWYGQYVQDRCRETAYQSLGSMPSRGDREWYSEHCGQ